MRNLALILILLHCSIAFNISGEIYSGNDFENLENVIIKISGDSSSKFLASDFYSVSLNQGSYVVEAFYYENGKLALYSMDYLEVQEDMQFDLILFYPEEASIDFLEYGEIDYTPKKEDNSIYLLAGFLLLLFIVALLFFWKNKHTEKPQEENQNKAESKKPFAKINLDDDAKLLIKVLSENENRIEQKELRNILGWTESKTSLVIAELESYGYLKRIKKGRKNLIKLYQGSSVSPSSEEPE